MGTSIIFSKDELSYVFELEHQRHRQSFIFKMFVSTSRALEAVTQTCGSCIVTSVLLDINWSSWRHRKKHWNYRAKYYFERCLRVESTCAFQAHFMMIPLFLVMVWTFWIKFRTLVPA